MAAASSSDGDGTEGTRTTGSTRRQAIRAAARGPARTLRHTTQPARRAEPLAAATCVEEPPRIFLSYSHRDVEVVRLLVEHLRDGGAIVSWDQDFAGGEDFDRAILAAIDGARCVIVVWSPTSVLSPYVRDEARRAQKVSKLITTYVAGFDLADVPLGFGSLHAIPVDDAVRIGRSLAVRGIVLCDRRGA